MPKLPRIKLTQKMITIPCLEHTVPTVIIPCPVNPKYTNLILGIRLGLGLGFRLGLELVRVVPNRKSNPNPNPNPKDQIRVFRTYWT